MHHPAVSTMTTQRIDRLLRSLVGVADVRILWRSQTLRAVHILRASGTQPHQLIRNIVSGLHAGFGIQILPTQLHVHEDVRVFDALDIAADVLTEPAEGDGTATSPATGSLHEGNGNGSAIKPQSNGSARKAVPNAAVAKPPSNGGHGNGHSSGASPVNASPPAVPLKKQESAGASRPAAPPESRRETAARDISARPSRAPADAVAAAAELVARRQNDDAIQGLRLERIDVERRGGTLRCRTVLALGDRLYSAIAEVPDSPSAEAELAARVAVDALRAGGITTAMLDGVGFITIGKTNYCVATVREPGSAHPRASAAPLIDSMAASATAAVLTALGSFTDARAQNRAHAGH